jgi:hypothetical protein
MPRKQPLGRKHKAGTGNNSTAQATRILLKTKVTTTAVINTKNVVRQVVRDLEKQDLERDEVQEVGGPLLPVSCFAGGMGICDAEKFWWHEQPGWGCSECPQYHAGVFRINDEFVRATASQREQRFGARRYIYGPALCGPMLKQREWEHEWFGSPCVRKRAADKRVGQQAAMRAISRLITLRGAGGGDVRNSDLRLRGSITRVHFRVKMHYSFKLSASILPFTHHP